MTNKTSPEDKVYPGSESYGLTKREYFAAASLTGLSANPELSQTIYDEVARMAVTQADSVIKALNEDQQ
jgi:hypothetical protein